MTDVKVGPELDALVAERVMGWRHLIGTDTVLYKDHPSLWGAKEMFWVPRHANTPVWHEKEWSPSTDIGNAWQVVEKLRERGLSVEIESPMPETEDDVWAVRLCDRDWWEKAAALDAEPSHLGVGDTAPEAICRAALLAVKEEEPNDDPA